MATRRKTANSVDRTSRAGILSELDRLGGLTVQEDALVFEGTRFVLPEHMAGDIPGAVRYLEDYQDQQERTHMINREFPFRPGDGAAAFDRAMRRVFGTSGTGEVTWTMFGPEPPELRTIAIGPGETAQVPWGAVGFGPLDATFHLGASRSERGVVFKITVEAPRKHRRRVQGFLDVVETELRERSIYRGKAIDGAEWPGFLDLNGTDAESVVYAADVMTQLEANLWSLLDHTQVMRDLRIPLKRAVLVEGPYGTGKTLAGALTAQRAVANGWTFVLNRPGQDDIMATLQTAQLYAPAVVWFEDIDTVGSGGSSMFISRLLDALDGVTAKGVEVVAGFTTNHVERLQKGLLRPGRVDTVIHIGELDAPGIERLIKVSVPDGLLSSDVDFTRVAAAFTGYVPAFAKEAIDRAMRYSIARNGGRPESVTTDDLVNAAHGLRAQHALMGEAPEGGAGVTIDGVLTGIIEESLSRTHLHQEDVYRPFQVNGRDVAREGVDA
jgi:ATPases of the AAA+ class